MEITKILECTVEYAVLLYYVDHLQFFFTVNLLIVGICNKSQDSLGFDFKNLVYLP